MTRDRGFTRGNDNAANTKAPGRNTAWGAYNRVLNRDGA